MGYSEFLKPGDYVRVMYHADYKEVYTVKAIHATRATLVTVVPNDPFGVGHEVSAHLPLFTAHGLMLIYSS
jgi:hypothetical protein